MNYFKFKGFRSAGSLRKKLSKFFYDQKIFNTYLFAFGFRQMQRKSEIFAFVFCVYKTKNGKHARFYINALLMQD